LIRLIIELKILNLKSYGKKNITMSWNTKTKTPIKQLNLKELKELMEETLKNVLIGSEIMNGVTYNKYKNFKKEGKPCWKQLLL
jgi:hypothetical protein